MRSFPEGYDELRLRIDRREQGSYQVHASTRSAEASASFALPFNEFEIENFILRVSRPRGRRRIHASALGDAKYFGGALFQALFRERVYGLYHDALAEARSQRRGLRITLCLSGSPELIDLPWEYLFDDPDFLAVSAFTPVVRYLDLPRGCRPLQVEAPLRLLGVVSSPADYEQLDVERERENLTRALSGLSEAGVIELDWLAGPTLGELLRALEADTFHALHYIGHATFDKDADQGVLLFEDDSGWARPVSGEKLGMILRDFSSLRLAVLNACEGARTSRTDPFAGVAGSLVQRDIPAVIAMQFEISDEAAILFSEAFYRAITAGSPVDAAIAAARLAMLAERSDDIEWGTPVLFMRVPDGRIFDLPEQPALMGESPPSRAGTEPPSRAVAAGMRDARQTDAASIVASGKPRPADAEGTASRQAEVPAAAARSPEPVSEPRKKVTARFGSSAVFRRQRAETSAARDRGEDVGGRRPLRRFRWPALGLLLAVAVAAAAIIALGSGARSAAAGQLFEGTLRPVPANHVTGSGTATLRLQGNLATVTIDVTGLLKGSSHPMHLHAYGWGTCPKADEARLHNGHMAISSADGIPYYGSMVFALTEPGGDTSNKSMFAFPSYPSTGSFHYRRTISISASVARQIRQNNAVIVVHGIDYDHAGTYDNVLGASDMGVSLPQEATYPALCGPLYALP